MDIELVQQIVDYLRSLVEPAVTAGYALVIKQVYYKMYFDIFINVVMLGIFIFSIWFWKGIDEIDWDGGEYLVAFILSLVPLIIFCANMASILNTVINPDWMAIELLVDLVR